MDPLLCVRNFPSELEDRTGFPLSRLSKGAKQQLPAKQAACLEACINPAEGVHHWRCPNHPDRKEELKLWKAGQAIDTDGDGKVDSIAVDTTGDGKADKVVKILTRIDTDGDGNKDSAGVDTDGDGQVDKVVKIVEEKGHGKESARDGSEHVCEVIASAGEGAKEQTLDKVNTAKTPWRIPVLDVSNFPAVLQNQASFALPPRSANGSEQSGRARILGRREPPPPPPVAKKVVCLEACINPAEGVHHWRCPNHPDRKEELKLWAGGLENVSDGAKHVLEGLESAGEGPKQQTLQKVKRVKMPWRIPGLDILGKLRGSSNNPSHAAAPGGAPTKEPAGGYALGEVEPEGRSVDLGTSPTGRTEGWSSAAGRAPSPAEGVEEAVRTEGWSSAAGRAPSPAEGMEEAVAAVVQHDATVLEAEDETDAELGSRRVSDFKAQFESIAEEEAKAAAKLRTKAKEKAKAAGKAEEDAKAAAKAEEEAKAATAAARAEATEAAEQVVAAEVADEVADEEVEGTRQAAKHEATTSGQTGPSCADEVAISGRMASEAVEQLLEASSYSPQEGGAEGMVASGHAAASCEPLASETTEAAVAAAAALAAAEAVSKAAEVRAAAAEEARAQVEEWAAREAAQAAEKVARAEAEAAAARAARAEAVAAAEVAEVAKKEAEERAEAEAEKAAQAEARAEEAEEEAGAAWQRAAARTFAVAAPSLNPSARTSLHSSLKLLSATGSQAVQAVRSDASPPRLLQAEEARLVAVREVAAMEAEMTAAAATEVEVSCAPLAPRVRTQLHPPNPFLRL